MTLQLGRLVRWHKTLLLIAEKSKLHKSFFYIIGPDPQDQPATILFGASTLSITASSITTFSILVLQVSPSIKTFRILVLQMSPSIKILRILLCFWQSQNIFQHTGLTNVTQHNNVQHSGLANVTQHKDSQDIFRFLAVSEYLSAHWSYKCHPA
jgi:hypothetical protein